jgi:methylmalonyl-CoA/ethylmalonyl-CoA epimerase
MQIHHIGYAVRNIDEAAERFRGLGFINSRQKTIDKARGVVIQFMHNGSLFVELIAPLNDESPITNFLKKIGPAPYHICYEVDDLDKQVIQLMGKGFKIIEKPLEAPALNDKRVVFLYQKDIGLLELVEKQ